MRKPEDNVKAVLCDLVAKGRTWDQAYAKLIGVLQENAHDLETPAQDLANKPHGEGETEEYVRFRLEGFQLAYDREVLYLNTTRMLQAARYCG